MTTHTTRSTMPTPPIQNKIYPAATTTTTGPSTMSSGQNEIDDTTIIITARDSSSHDVYGACRDDLEMKRSKSITKIIPSPLFNDDRENTPLPHSNDSRKCVLFVNGSDNESLSTISPRSYTPFSQYRSHTRTEDITSCSSSAAKKMNGRRKCVSFVDGGDHESLSTLLDAELCHKFPQYQSLPTTVDIINSHSPEEESNDGRKCVLFVDSSDHESLSTLSPTSSYERSSQFPSRERKKFVKDDSSEKGCFFFRSDGDDDGDRGIVSDVSTRNDFSTRASRSKGRNEGHGYRRFNKRETREEGNGRDSRSSSSSRRRHNENGHDSKKRHYYLSSSFKRSWKSLTSRARLWSCYGSSKGVIIASRGGVIPSTAATRERPSREDSSFAARSSTPSHDMLRSSPSTTSHHRDDDENGIELFKESLIVFSPQAVTSHRFNDGKDNDYSQNGGDDQPLDSNKSICFKNVGKNLTSTSLTHNLNNEKNNNSLSKKPTVDSDISLDDNETKHNDIDPSITANPAATILFRAFVIFYLLFSLLVSKLAPPPLSLNKVTLPAQISQHFTEIRLPFHANAMNSPHDEPTRDDDDRASSMIEGFVPRTINIMRRKKLRDAFRTTVLSRSTSLTNLIFDSWGKNVRSLGGSCVWEERGYDGVEMIGALPQREDRWDDCRFSRGC